MNNTFDIRLDAIVDNFVRDGDRLRYSRELSRLEVDVSASLKRCLSAGYKCKEFENILDIIDDKIRGKLVC